VARRRKLTKVSVSILGAVIFIMIFGVVSSSGQDLALLDPFSNDFDFLVVESIFPALDISLLTEGVVLSDFIQNSPNGGLNYFCKLKMNTVVDLKGQPSFELNTQFQPLSPLLPTAQLTTRSGGELIDFRLYLLL